MAFDGSTPLHRRLYGNSYKHQGSVYEGRAGGQLEAAARRDACRRERRSLRSFFRHGGASPLVNAGTALGACGSLLLYNSAIWSP